MMRPLPTVKDKTEYIKISGGLDLVTPAMSISPGKSIVATNYEALDSGGLQRIDGYERFDGQTAPSSGVYYYATGVFDTGVVATGDTVIGGLSDAHGYVLNVSSTHIVLALISGTFDDNDEFFKQTAGVYTIDFVVDAFGDYVISDDGEYLIDTLVGAEYVGYALSEVALGGAPTSILNATYLNLAADYYRSFIAEPPGSGPVRGGGKLGSTVYVFRDNAAGTACDLFKSTTSGWEQVELFSEIDFTAGTGLISDGDVIDQDVTGASAYVRRVVLESGEWGTDAAGRLIISNVSGLFNNTAELFVSEISQASAASTVSAITIAAGGRYETVNYNFFGGASTYRMYGCGGNDYGFEFDGTTYVPIHTGMTDDTPDHVVCHKNYLMFSFDASHQLSSLNNPYSWTPLTGAGEIGIGDTISGYTRMSGEAVSIVGERGTYQLLGSTTDDFKLDTISPDAGGKAYTIQNIASSALMLGDFGIQKIQSSDTYGNFSQDTVSRSVQPLIDILKDIAVASSVYRSRNQYRVYGSDGTGLCVTSSTERNGLDYVAVYYITNIVYPININCVFTGDDDTIYICDDSGMVYQADRGSSFDGDEIEAYGHTIFTHSNSPMVLKSYLRAIIDATTEGYSYVGFYPNFSYSDPRYPQHTIKSEEISGIGGRWDAAIYGNLYYWDTSVVSSISIPLRGSGNNVAIVWYTKSDMDLGHRIDGVMLHYIPRRLCR